MRQKFTGYEADAETTLNFAQARYQSPMQGRFTSVDPENAGADPSHPQSWNGYSYAVNTPTVFVDPDGRKIKICDNEGRCTEISDADANAYTFNKNYQKANGFSVKGSSILDAEGNKVGTWVRTSFDDLNETANRFIFGDRTDPGMTGRAPAMEKGILIATAVNMAPVLVIVGSPTLAGGGITTLGLSGEAATGGELAGLSLSQLNTLIRGTQQQLLRQLFGRGVQGAQEALATGQLPAGLTREALLVYAEIARRYVEQGRDATGVQALRLEIIKQALEKLK